MSQLEDKERVLPSPASCSTQVSRGWTMPTHPHGGAWSCAAQSAASNVNPIQKHPHRHT